MQQWTAAQPTDERGIFAALRLFFRFSGANAVLIVLAGEPPLLSSLVENILPNSETRAAAEATSIQGWALLLLFQRMPGGWKYHAPI